MGNGTLEWLEMYGKEYRAFLEKWKSVRHANENGDFSQGYATTNGNGDYIIRGLEI